MGKLTAVLALLVLLLAAAPARGAAVETIIDDCAASESGFLTGSYANDDLRAALRALRGEMVEYSGCADAIREALRVNREREPAGRDDGGGAGGGSGGGGGSDPGSGSGSGETDGRGGTTPGTSQPAVDVAAAGPDGNAALAAAGDGAAGGGATPLVSRREGFALASGPGRELPASLLTALGLLAALAAVCGGGALIARRRR